MGAPTWPPTPEEADRATLEEYGEYAAAVLAAREAETNEDAERARKNLTTRLGVLVSEPESMRQHDAGLGGPDPAADLGTLNSGGISRLPAGGVTIVEPKDMPGYVQTAKLELQLVSRGAGFTYEMATGDMSQANFTQGRMGMLMQIGIVKFFQFFIHSHVYCISSAQRFAKLSLYGIATGGSENRLTKRGIFFERKKTFGGFIFLTCPGF